MRKGWGNTIRRVKLFQVLLIGMFFFGITIFDGSETILRPFAATIGFIAKPFEAGVSVVGFHIRSAIDFFGSVGSLKDDNERLMRENNRLIAENALLTDMQRENELLRKEIDLLPRETFQLKAAEIIGEDRHGVSDWIMIDKGSSDGIRAGMPIIVDQGVLVGRVSETLSKSSKVSLVTSPESAVNGIDAQTEAKGVVRGQYGLGIVMDTVFQSDILNQGDMVITSGLGEDFPRGLLIGRVEKVNSSNDGLFQQATLNPIANFSKLRTVFIVL